MLEHVAVAAEEVEGAVQLLCGERQLGLQVREAHVAVEQRRVQLGGEEVVEHRAEVRRNWGVEGVGRDGEVVEQRLHGGGVEGGDLEGGGEAEVPGELAGERLVQQRGGRGDVSGAELLRAVAVCAYQDEIRRSRC